MHYIPCGIYVDGACLGRHYPIFDVCKTTKTEGQYHDGKTSIFV